MIKACVLGSGSKGNCIYIQVDYQHLLIDCGFTKKQTICRLAMIGRRLEDIDNIYITHDHKDHCAPWIMKENRVPGLLPKNIRQFPLSHDSECVGYTITDKDGNKAVIAVDTGCISEEALKHFFDASMILIETNYDVFMLAKGKYGVDLLERIASDKGHLRNECASEVIELVDNQNLRYVVCMHMSSSNNNPVLARFCMKSTGTKAEVVMSEQNKPTKLMVVI